MHSEMRIAQRCALLVLAMALATAGCAVNVDTPPAQAEQQQPAVVDAGVAVDANAAGDADVAVDAGVAADADVAGDAGVTDDAAAALDAADEIDAADVVDTADAAPADSACQQGDGATRHDGGAADRPPFAGSATTLEIATWNLKNFPTAPGVSEQWLVSSIRAMDHDIVAVEEIGDTAAFDAAMAQLPGYASVVSSDTYWNGNYQKTGVIYRTGVVTVNRVADLFVDDSSAFPRPPLRLDLHLSLPGAAAGGSTVEKDLALIVVHLKAGTASDDRARRRAAAERIESYIAEQRLATPDLDLLFAGDFNAKVVRSESADLWPLFDDGTFVTEPLEAAGAVSYLPYPKLIDHLFVVDRAPLDLAAAPALVVPLDDQIADYTSVMSDHLPVAAFFELRQP